jgi:uncharacterized protein YbjT (DUF2867 family)
VAGATGRFGGLVDVLLARGHDVRAITRQPDGLTAVRLRSEGARIVYGDFDDRASIETAARGVDVVFATGTAHRAGADGELRHGRNVADAAVAAGVAHLVYSSGDGASETSPVPLFRVKHEVEEHIRSLGIPHTILAPVYFMENLFNPWNLPALHAGTFPSPIPIEQPLQQLAIDDLVAFAGLVIERPEQFAGHRIELASDKLTAVEAAASLSLVLNRPLQAKPIPKDQLPPGVRAMFTWLEAVGHDVDTSARCGRAIRRSACTRTQTGHAPSAHASAISATSGHRSPTEATSRMSVLRLGALTR